jgi:hypothetical protein
LKAKFLICQKQWRLEVWGEIIATAFGKLGTSPSIVQPCAKKSFLNSARLKAPQRGTALSRALFKKLFLAQGWTIEGEVPNLPKAV